MDSGSAGPSSATRAWQVKVRWLPWRPAWGRRRSRAWAVDAALPTYAAGRAGCLEVPVLVASVGAGLLVVLVGLVVALATWVAIACGAVGSFASHAVLRRPFLVEAVASGGEWAGWWTAGWMNTRRVRRDVLQQLAAGRAPEEVTVDVAL